MVSGTVEQCPEVCEIWPVVQGDECRRIIGLWLEISAKWLEEYRVV